MLRWSSVVVVALAGALCACSQVQDFHGPQGDAPPMTPGEPASPAPLAAPACGTVDDPSSCGACGHSCLGGACRAGACQPVVLAESQGLTTGQEAYLAGPRAIVIDDTHVYWTTRDGLFRVAAAGGVPQELADAGVVSTFAMSSDDQTNLLLVHGAHVYVRSADRRSLVRIPKGGGVPEVVVPPLDPDWTFGQFLFHGERLIWIEQAFINRHWLSACDSLPCAAGAAYEPWQKDDIIQGLTLWPGTVATAGGELCVAFGPTSAVSGGYGVTCGVGAAGTPTLTTGAASVSALVAEPATTEGNVTVYGSTLGVVFRTVLGPKIAGSFLPDTVLASGASAAWSAPIIGGDHLYWVGAASTVFRVEKSGRALPEAVLSGWQTTTLAVTNDALFFGTSDGKVARLARPLSKAHDPLP